MFKVAGNHSILAEHPAHSITSIAEDGTLTVFDTDGKTPLATYAPGTWSVAGDNVEHGYLTDDPNCPECRGTVR